MNLTAIACMAANRVIGSGGAIPWHLPEDLRFFKGKTLGHPVVMGRRTWESLPAGGLKHRRNIVLSRSLLPGDVEGAEVVWSPEELADRMKGDDAFVIGGAEIYKALLPWTNEVLLTVLEEETDGDVFMPEFEGEFGEPEILDRMEGVCEWRRYVRKSSK